MKNGSAFEAKRIGIGMLHRELHPDEVAPLWMYTSRAPLPIAQEEVFRDGVLPLTVVAVTAAAGPAANVAAPDGEANKAKKKTTKSDGHRRNVGCCRRRGIPGRRELC